MQKLLSTIPIINMRLSNIIITAVILLSFAIGIYLYPQMPDNMISHWNAAGQPDGFMPKFWGLFLMPIISVGMFLLFLAIPRIDPLKQNIDKFRGYFDGMIVLIIVFLFYIFMLSIFWNIGFTFSMIQALVPALGLLFIYMGLLVSKAKRNWFIGIRTPWTLSSEKVWDKTHSLGGKMFAASGIIALFGMLFLDYAIWLVLVPVLFSAIYAMVYSYFEYRKETKRKK